LKPTYKGLKPVSCRRIRRKSPSVWSLPIRDWNYSLTQTIRNLETCLKPTYKGLKPCFEENKASNSRGVWSLPIRDWNLTLLILLFCYFCVWSLPIRDWNFPYLIIFLLPSFPFEAYL